MKLHKYLLPCHLVLALLAGPALSETYKETFECVFEKAREDRPTPTRVVFSTEETARLVRFHEVEIPGLKSPAGSARIKRNSAKILSFSWSGREYTFLETGSPMGKSASVYTAINLLTRDFSIFLDRRTMKAKVRSQSLNGHRPLEGQSIGSCKLRNAPGGVNSNSANAKAASPAITIRRVASTDMAGIKSFKCKLNSREERGWIPNEIVFSINLDAARARAYGPLIQEANEKPIDVGFKTTRQGEYQMKWKLSLASSTARQFRLGYVAIFDPKTRKIEVRARFLSADTTNRPRGYGNCVSLDRQSLF